MKPYIPAPNERCWLFNGHYKLDVTITRVEQIAPGNKSLWVSYRYDGQPEDDSDRICASYNDWLFPLTKDGMERLRARILQTAEVLQITARNLHLPEPVELRTAS